MLGHMCRIKDFAIRQEALENVSLFNPKFPVPLESYFIKISVIWRDDSWDVICPAPKRSEQEAAGWGEGRDLGPP